MCQVHYVCKCVALKLSTSLYEAGAAVCETCRWLVSLERAPHSTRGGHRRQEPRLTEIDYAFLLIRTFDLICEGSMHPRFDQFLIKRKHEIRTYSGNDISLEILKT